MWLVEEDDEPLVVFETTSALATQTRRRCIAQAGIYDAKQGVGLVEQATSFQAHQRIALRSDA